MSADTVLCVTRWGGKATPLTNVCASSMAIALSRSQVLCETSEVWMGVESPEDLRTSRQVVHILHLLTDVMWVTQAEQAAGDCETVDKGSRRRGMAPGNVGSARPSAAGEDELPQMLPSETR